jgi:hypothetical protein
MKVNNINIPYNIGVYSHKNAIPRILKNQLGANILKSESDIKPPNIEIIKVDFNIGYTLYNMTLDYKGQAIKKVVVECGENIEEYRNIYEAIKGIEK